MTTAFAVVDVETNGSRADANRVIEVALVRVERRRIVDRWRTFLRPDRPIPHWVTRLTGITNEDVTDAPSFDEVAGELLRRLDGCVFVAHNASFDAGFLRAEFTRAGRAWDPDVLCTLRLGRKLVPVLRSHSLDSMAAHFGVLIEGRHRALGDAVATAEILARLLKCPGARELVKRQLRERAARRAMPLPPGADDLPRGRGVWVVRDADGRALATGRAINLYEKVRERFPSLPKKAVKAAARVDFIACASDLEAQAAEASLLAPAKEEPAFLTVAPDGTFKVGPPGPGRVFGPFKSVTDLRARIRRAGGLPVEEAIAAVRRGLKPLGLLREPPAGPGVLVREPDRLLWVQQGRLRKAWPLGPDVDESEIRAEIRVLLDAPFDPASLPEVAHGRGVPVETFLK